MMDFPTAPTPGTIVTFANGQSYRWNGGQWDTVAASTLTDPYSFPVADMQLHSKAAGQVALNSKKDGTGVDAAVFNNTGNLTLNGAGGGIAYSRLGSNNIGFRWDGTNLNYDIDGGGAASRMWANANASWVQASNGYHQFPNGLIIQWGSYGGNAADVIYTLPVAFPNFCANVSAVVYGLPQANVAWTVTIDQISRTQFAYRPRYVQSGGTVASGTIPIWWLAVGW